MPKITEVHYSFKPNQISKWVKGVDYAEDELPEVSKILGIGMSKAAENGFMQDYAMDTIQQPLTTPSITTPVQFLQNWRPGIVEIVTAARKIDELIGVDIAGNWYDEQVVQQVVEQTGTPAPYGDLTNVPYADWNQNFETRTVVRFEQGFRIGVLEQARAAASPNLNSEDQKRRSAALQLEIARNAIGFYGYNAGDNHTYGFLNDPNLPAYVSTPSGTPWANATFLQIQTDLLTAFVALQNQSKDLIDPLNEKITLAVATDAVGYLGKTTDLGLSVRAWLNDTYPNIEIKSAPQLSLANGGANVFYVYADSVEDGSSTDDGKTFMQIVPSKFMMLGVSQMEKGRAEDYSNATAGVMLKRPYAVVRYTGI